MRINTNDLTLARNYIQKYQFLIKETKATAPDQYFMSDITYVKSRERTHYLSLVTDAYGRKIMGYHLSDDISAENVVKAIQMAIKNRNKKKAQHKKLWGI